MFHCRFFPVLFLCFATSALHAYDADLHFPELHDQPVNDTSPATEATPSIVHATDSIRFTDLSIEKVSSILYSIKWKLGAHVQQIKKFELEYKEDNSDWQVGESISSINMARGDYYILHKDFSSQSAIYRIVAYHQNGSRIESGVTGFSRSARNEVPIKIDPNPADDYATISINAAQNISNTRRIELISAGGKKIVDMACPQKMILINTASFTPDNYVVNIIEGASITSAQMVVKHQ